MEEDKIITVVEVAAPTTTMEKRKQKKAGWFPLLPSVEEIFKWSPLQWPVTTWQGQGIKKQKKNKSRFPMLLSVQLVLGWALLTAGRRRGRYHVHHRRHNSCQHPDPLQRGIKYLDRKSVV